MIAETTPLESSRREFIRNAITTVTAARANNGRGPLEADPFTPGVASGDLSRGSVVLWTRLAPEPLAEDGGMPDRRVPVRWTIPTDGEMDNTVGRDTAKTRPEYAARRGAGPQHRALLPIQSRPGSEPGRPSARSPVARVSKSVVDWRAT
ncbi:PhoD-like phosphatase N-terminal domain-containing protein [Halomicroarcula sp. F27]|uniref:PhoD-like phosphatase N-terminal domain-containing protein n=1 Tax=Haloarcula nitratireducens TaxID=2487749 RepID=A0AAW4PEZ7_9EURY|nr:PhoD-like phosphatase N-terminal domain-containing protein [Halomicroarcula nitratireducens]